MFTMNELVDLRMQQQIAHELYRQQIMQRIPDPFPPMMPFHMQHPIIVPQRPTLSGVEAKLENNELWKQFHKTGTEMIITKTGRRMFPSMRVSVSGLEDDSNYCVLLEMVPIGDCRYKFSGSHWIPAGGAEPQSPQRMFLHPDSPATGTHWQSQAIIFNKVKLTNNTLDSNGHIVLTSMHKYQPRLHIIRTSDLTQLPWAPQKAFVFPETEFVAVTAYQNDRITKLKIDNNPFAKGFRETGQSRCKRKQSTMSCDEQEGGDHPPSPTLCSFEDDRISVTSGQMDSPTTKRCRTIETSDDENHSKLNGCRTRSPYHDEAMYSAMYQREFMQPQPLSPSPLDIAAATCFVATAHVNPAVAAPVNGIPSLLMPLSPQHHPQMHLHPSHFLAHLPHQLSNTFLTPTNAMAESTTEALHLNEEQNFSNSDVILSEATRPLNEVQTEAKKAKRNNFSISAILAF